MSKYNCLTRETAKGDTFRKYLLSIALFAIVLLLCTISAKAETFGDFKYKVLNNGTIKITGYPANSHATSVVIPAEIDGKKQEQDR